MRLKSWLAAAAGVVAAAPAVAQNPYPTNFDVTPAGATAPGLPAPTPPTKPGFCLPGESCAPSTYHDGPATIPGRTDPLATSASAVNQRLPHTFWVQGEYLLWWARSMGVPELATSVPAGNVAQGDVFGRKLFPNTRKVQYGPINGFRVSGGVQLTECYSLEGSFFETETKVEGNVFTGSGLPGTNGLGRAYFPAGGTTGRVLYSALPGQYSGVLSVQPGIKVMGLDANLGVDTFHLFADHNRALYGFRFFDLAERITITDASTFPSGRVNTVQDVFAARNQFYGGQVGLHSTFFGGSTWSLESIGKFAVGGVNQRVEVFGGNANIDPTGVVDREAGGLFARPSNSAVFERDKFAVALDLTLNLGYQITPRLRTTFGYSIFYLSSVVRPGSAIDRTVNDSALRFVAPADRTASTAVRPTFGFDRVATDFWTQGLNFGVTFGF